MSIPLGQRGQPVDQSLSHVRVFCVATGSGTSSAGASLMLTFGLARSLQVDWQVATSNRSRTLQHGVEKITRQLVNVLSPPPD